MSKNNPYAPPSSNVVVERTEGFVSPRKIHIWSFFWRFYTLFIFLSILINLLLPKFRDPIYYQYSISFSLFVIAIAFLILGMFGKKSAIYLIKGKGLKLNKELWKKIHYSNIFIILLFSFLNFLVAYFFNGEIWVNSKLIGYYLLMPILITLTLSYYVLKK